MIYISIKLVAANLALNLHQRSEGNLIQFFHLTYGVVNRHWCVKSVELFFNYMVYM